VIVVVLPELQQRVDAELERRQALTAAAVAAAAAEQAEADRVLEQARKARRQQLADRAMNTPAVIRVHLADRDEWNGLALRPLILDMTTSDEAIQRIDD